MATELYILSVFLFATAVYALARVPDALKFHGKMLVTCPETLEPAAVKVDLIYATLAFLLPGMQLRLSDCSRWPERKDCDQDCLVQLERDPRGHRVWTVASHWFEGKNCAYCQRPIERLSHLDRSPAVVGAENITAEWNKIPAEKLPEKFSTARPVCWDCHIAETLVREHPDLVVHRPWKKCGPLGEYVPANLHAAGAEHRQAA